MLFLKILSWNGLVTLKVKVNDPHISTFNEPCWMLVLEILSWNGLVTLKVKVNDPHFQYELNESHDAYLVQIWWFQPKLLTSYPMDKLNFLGFWVKMAKIYLKVKVNGCHFQQHLRVSNWCMFGANFVISAQICELSCRQGQGYGQMDRHKQQQYPCSLKGWVVKMILLSRGSFVYGVIYRHNTQIKRSNRVWIIEWTQNYKTNQT